MVSRGSRMIWTFCRVFEGTLSYPFELTDLRGDGISLNARAHPDTLARHGVYHVHIQAQPGQEIDKVWVQDPMPVLTGGFWQLGWTQHDQTPEELQAERAEMIVSRLTGRLVLGETTCAMIDAIAADPNTPWAMRETILNAATWRRTSQAMDELGYVLGYQPDQMDALFRAAMASPE